MHMLFEAVSRATIPSIRLPSRDTHVPNVDDSSIGMIIVACVVPITVVSTIFAFSRLFVKGWIQRRLQFDDGILFAAVAAGWTATGTTLKAVALGNGRHTTMLTDRQKEEILGWTVMAFSFGIISLALPKLAVVALINRVLNPNRLHRIFLWALVVLCAAGLLGNLVGLIAQCPPEFEVQMSYTKMACLGPEKAVGYSISTSGISAATNGYLAAYVALSVRKLKITRRKRIALGIALVLGMFCYSGQPVNLAVQMNQQIL
ncbi:hypothetical protein CCHL11_09760 [Colletotrichum chlorophyti]|uniref:Rhodopsin domain-containing protein n=1 Tax=Colletotrichum chlorophyti TaxID=708187 RepID=A0A1Q8RDC4_9PEZI|nr:hypothetical protein CCHL11_09760 [Colletotrichum chlorophyti]